jgi:hypothetical protein
MGVRPLSRVELMPWVRGVTIQFLALLEFFIITTIAFQAIKEFIFFHIHDNVLNHQKGVRR